MRLPTAFFALLAVFAAGFAAPALAQSWGQVANISSTMGVNANRLCMGEATRGDLGCPTYAPYVSSTSGYVGIGDTTPSAMLTVTGTSSTTGGILLRASNSGGDRFRMYPGGNASVLFRIEQASGGLAFIDPSNNYILSMGGSSRRVAIGFDSQLASTTLDVSGTLKLRDSGDACDSNRTGTIKYTGGDFYVCRNGSSWESLTSVASGVTPTVTTGASGSLVYRDATGNLLASSSLSISSTTGSVGIGAGAPASLGNNGLYALGSIFTNTHFYLQDNMGIRWSTGGSSIYGGDLGSNKYLSFVTSNTEAMRIVSTGYVGIGTSTPSAALHVMSPADSAASGIRLDSTTGISAFRLQLYPSGNYSSVMKMNTNGSFNVINTSGSVIWSLDGGNLRTGVRNATPSTTLDVSGTLKIADGGEACDSNRTGAIKYSGGAFYICQNTSNGWEPLATSGASANTDRITSNSQAGVTANSTGYISLTTGGVTGTAYFTPASVLVNAGVSSTGTISATSVYAGNFGTSGSLVFRNTDGTLTGSSSVFVSSSLLYINGLSSDASLLNLGNVASGSNNISLRRSPGLEPNIAFYSGTNSGVSATQLRALADGGIRVTDGTASNEYFRIVSSGFVGIGTSTPATNLHVYNSTAFGGIRMEGNTPIFDISSTGTKAIRFGDVTAPRWTLGMNGTAGSHYFYIGYAQTLPGSGFITLVSTGLVGIGVTPTTPLHVSGTIRMADSGEACDSNRTGAIKYTGGDFYVCRNGSSWESLTSIGSGGVTPTISTGASGSLVYRDATGNLLASSSLSISSTTGSVGIGAGAPATLGNNGLYATGTIQTGGHMVVSSSLWLGNNQYIYWNFNPVIQSDGSYLRLFTSSTEAMRIVSTGFVGIGTSNPSYTLHVNGYVYSTSGLIMRRPSDLASAAILTASSNTLNIRGLTSSGKAISFQSSGANEAAALYYDGATTVANLAIGLNGVTPTASLEVSGTVSSTAVQLSRQSSLGTCGSGAYGTIKIVNGRPYYCRQ